MPEIARVRKKLDAQPFVLSSRYISKEEAKEQLIKDLGEDPEELLGYNPAQDCIEIFLPLGVREQRQHCHDQPGNPTGEQRGRLAVSTGGHRPAINDNLSKVMVVLLVLAAVLLFISFTLIRNTISVERLRETVSYQHDEAAWERPADSSGNPSW